MFTATQLISAHEKRFIFFLQGGKMQEAVKVGVKDKTSWSFWRSCDESRVERAFLSGSRLTCSLFLLFNNRRGVRGRGGEGGHKFKAPRPVHRVLFIAVRS